MIMGGLNVDTTVLVRDLPAKGETIFASGMTTDIGGKGLNQALALHRAGADVRLVGTIGHDAAGAAIIDFMTEQGLVADHISRSDGAATGQAFIAVDQQGDNTIVVVPGANTQTGPEDIDALQDTLPQAAAIVANCEAPLDAVAHLFAAARDAGVQTVLNPSPVPNDHEQLLALTDMLVVNEEEAQALSQATDGASQADVLGRLHALGSGRIVLTLGSEGCLYSDGKGALAVPAERVDAVDTTAAGDTFLGYFVASLVQGQSPGEACARATKAAALCVQVPGASAAIPHRSDLV